MDTPHSGGRGDNWFGSCLVGPSDMVTSYYIHFFFSNIWLLSTVGMGIISNHSWVSSRRWRKQDTLGRTN